MGRRGRPPHPGPLTPAEQRVLALIREGKPNAEIAVVLDVSVNTVRYHVSNLLSKAAVSSRGELAVWTPRSKRERRGVWNWASISLAKVAVIGTSGIVTGGAALMVILAAVDGSNGAEDVMPEPFVAVDEIALKEAGFEDTGSFLRSEDGGDPVLGHSPRDLFSVLLVDGAPLLVGEEGRVSPLPFFPGNGSVDINLTWNEETYTVHLSMGGMVKRPNRQDVITSTGDAEVRLLPAPVRTLFVYVTARGRTAAATRAGETTNRATVSANGHLWIQPTPIDPALVADAWTGANLDTATAIEAGTVDAVNQYMLFTGCYDGVCLASYRPAFRLAAPLGGLLTCESSTTLRLDGDEVTLRFEWADTGYGGPPEFDCEPHQVAAGETIAPNRHYEITAYALDGRRLSLAVSRDGRLYAGEFAPAVGCPCREGI